MSPTQLLAVAIGGASGAVLRFVVSMALAQSTARGIPLGTLSVNAAGSLVLGAIVALAQREPRIPAELRLFIGTGFCGGLTTFSTFAVETLALPLPQALGNVALNLAVSLIAAAVGSWLVGCLPEFGAPG